MVIGNQHNAKKHVCAATVLKALLLGHEVILGDNVFRYFRKGQIIELPNDIEAEVLEEGVFKKCEVTCVPFKGDEEPSSYVWLLWISSLAEFVTRAENITSDEMAIIVANLTLSKKK